MNKAATLKKKFLLWTGGHNLKSITGQNEEELIDGLTRIGISISSIYDINDALTIRLYASELLLKRLQSGISDFDHYLRSIERLVSYAEFLDEFKSGNKDSSVMSRLENNVTEHSYMIVEPADSTITNKKSRDDHSVSLKADHERSAESVNIKENSNRIEDEVSSDHALIIAYYLSRMDITGVKELGYSNFSVAFKELGELLGRKPATIKNMRDEFDPYFDNPRAGWYQRPLRKSRQIIFNKYSTVSDEELTSVIQRIITGYKNNMYENKEYRDGAPFDNMDSDSVKAHKTIRLSSTVMKEIKRNKDNRIVK